MQTPSTSSVKTSLEGAYTWATQNKPTILKGALLVGVLVALGVILRLYLNIIVAICVPVGLAILGAGGFKAYCTKVKAITDRQGATLSPPPGSSSEESSESEDESSKNK